MVSKVSNADPKNINSRLYNQIAKLLDDLEKPRRGEDAITIRERIAALIAVGRLQLVFVNLRKEKTDDGGNTGSAVRRYSAAFKQNAGRRRAAVARSVAAAEPDGDDDPFADDGDAA